MFVSLQNSYIETQIPNVILLRDEDLMGIVSLKDETLVSLLLLSVLSPMST